MKTKSFPRGSITRTLTLLGALAMLGAGSLAQAADSSGASAHSSSPRAREEFPAHPANGRAKPTRFRKISTEANRAMLNSPRYREEHPEVLRGTAVQTVTSASVPERVALDPAARTNPRLREEYPALKAR